MNILEVTVWASTLNTDLGVGDGRERVVDAGGGGGHGQEGGDGQHHSGRGRLVVQPEGHPGDTDRHEGGDVDGEDVVRQLVERRSEILGVKRLERT